MVCKTCKDPIRWLHSLGKHYQPIYGFETKYIKMGKIKEARVEGFGRILDNITGHIGDIDGLKILDVGSNLGWFCFELAEMGAETTGIEMIKRRTDVCKRVSKMLQLPKDNPRFINGNAVRWVLKSDESFDYILILNVLHHILLANEAGGWKMFNKLINNSNGIFAMIRSSLKAKRSTKRWNLKYPKNIPKSVIEQSDATDYDVLERIHGRTIYFFYINK